MSMIMRGTDRLVVPISLHARVVDVAHEGPQGVVRTKCELFVATSGQTCRLRHCLKKTNNQTEYTCSDTTKQNAYPNKKKTLKKKTNRKYKQNNQH